VITVLIIVDPPGFSAHWTVLFADKCTVSLAGN